MVFSRKKKESRLNSDILNREFEAIPGYYGYLRNLNHERSARFLYWKKGMEKQVSCRFPAKELPSNCLDVCSKM
jgi:hypothetical protein